MKQAIGIVILCLMAPFFTVRTAHAEQFSDPFIFTSTDLNDWHPSPFTVNAEDVANQYSASRSGCATSSDPYLYASAAGDEESFPTTLHTETYQGQYLNGTLIKLCVRVTGPLTGTVNLRAVLFNTATGESWESVRLGFVNGDAPSPTRYTADIPFSPGRLISTSDRWAVGFRVESGTASNVSKVVVHGMFAQARWSLMPITAPIEHSLRWTNIGQSIVQINVNDPPAGQMAIRHFSEIKVNNGSWFKCGGGFEPGYYPGTRNAGGCSAPNAVAACVSPGDILHYRTRAQNIEDVYSNWTVFSQTMVVAYSACP